MIPLDVRTTLIEQAPDGGQERRAESHFATCPYLVASRKAKREKAAKLAEQLAAAELAEQLTAEPKQARLPGVPDPAAQSSDGSWH
jgi:hypothetical protein